MSENKTVFEQLEEVQKELKDLKEKQRTLIDQLREDDPKIIEFVQTAKRIWRFHGEKSELRRENKKVAKKSIVGLILLAIYLACSFLFVTYPYGWILPIFSTVVCIAQGIIQILRMRPSGYELEYNEIPSFWRYAELDDNDIISATKNKWWLILLRACVFIIPLAISVEMLIYLDGIWNILCWVPVMFIALLSLPFMNSNSYGYRLHFINDKNDIEYHYLKEFMTRNNLK